MPVNFTRSISAVLLFLSAFSVYSESRLADIQKKGILKVCIWPEYYGISFVDPRTQSLSGIDVDLANELAAHLGVKTSFVPSSFAALISDVNSDKCDIAMFAIGITPERQGKIRFTAPHLRSDIYAITTKSNKKIRSWEDIDKKGTVVAVAKGTLHEPIMKRKLKHATLLIVESNHAREKEVESGRADVFMTDYPFGMRMTARTDWARLVSPSSTFHLTSYAWAMKNGDDPFWNEVENFLRIIKKDGRLRRYAEKYKLDPIVVL